MQPFGLLSSVVIQKCESIKIALQKTYKEKKERERMVKSR